VTQDARDAAACRTLWEACRFDFDPDGSTRAIYVLETEESHWDALLHALRRSPWRAAFSIDGFAAPLPRYGIEAFAMWREAVPLLELAVGPAVVRCHFRRAEQVEFDFDPEAVRDPEALEALLRFMAWVGRLLGRSVLLTPEATPERPILEYVTAARRVRFHPVAE
jgi:hypothetical protein